MFNLLTGVCLSALALTAVVPSTANHQTLSQTISQNLNDSQYTKMHDLIVIIDKITSKHSATVGELEEMTGRRLRPIPGQFREYTTDLRKQQALQGVKTCILAKDDLRCIELIVNPNKSIKPRDIQSFMGDWTRLGDEEEKVFQDNLVLIYQREWGQIRFDFKNTNQPALYAVYITSS